MTPQTRQRWTMLARLLVVAVGGYAIASLVALLVSLVLPRCCGWSRADGVLVGSLLGFFFYTVAALWLFSTRHLAIASVIAVVAVCVNGIVFAQ